MSKRASEHDQEYSKRSLKRPILNKDANLISIPQFKLGGDWNAHRDCLEDYFDSKNVGDDTKKKISILITSIGQEAYETMRDLCKPVLPNHKTFEQLSDIMEKHYSEIFIFNKRKQFHSLQQFNSETVSQWYTRVNEYAAQCEFGEQLDERIKDQFLIGMQDRNVLDCVLNAGYKKSLKNIIEIALKKEEKLRPIQKLPEELMIQILSYLPIADRIRIERVNKSWGKIAKKIVE